MIEVRKKLSTILIGSWAHWYCHWEMWAMFWIGLAATYLAECPLNARYYEFTAGMSVVSVTICSISNLLSDYRLNLPYGWKRAVFNLSCFFLLSWPLRIIYPCYFGITMDQYDDFDDPDSVVVDNQ